jgi:hypothetical protein
MRAARDGDVAGDRQVAVGDNRAELDWRDERLEHHRCVVARVSDRADDEGAVVVGDLVAVLVVGQVGVAADTGRVLPVGIVLVHQEHLVLGVRVCGARHRRGRRKGDPRQTAGVHEERVERVRNVHRVDRAQIGDGHLDRLVEPGLGGDARLREQLMVPRDERLGAAAHAERSGERRHQQQQEQHADQRNAALAGPIRSRRVCMDADHLVRTLTSVSSVLSVFSPSRVLYACDRPVTRTRT